MSAGEKVPRDVALVAAHGVLAWLGRGATGDEAFRSASSLSPLELAERSTYPTCHNAVVAGSLRRGAALVGDVELVLLTRLVDGPPLERADMFAEPGPPPKVAAALVALDALAESPFARRGAKWGEKYRRLEWRDPEVGVDCFVVHDPLQFGYVLTVRTGSALFGKALMLALRRVGCRGEGGYIRSDAPEWKARGGIVPTVHERDVFRNTGLPWVEIAERSAREGEELPAAARRWGFAL